MEEKVEPLTVEEAKKYIGNIFSHEGRYVELVAVVEVPLGPYAIILSSPCDKPTVTHVTNLFFIP